MDSIRRFVAPVAAVCRCRFARLGGAGLVLTLCLAAAAADDIRTERIQFAKGASSATVQGRIRGDETVDYLVGARKGQVANISLATRHGATFFNLLAPGQTEVAFFNGSVGQNQFEGALPASGDYRIRVYMMRSAARRNEVADYRLEVAIAAAPRATAAPAAETGVAGTAYHATGHLPCALGSGQPVASCRFGVKRGGRGDAMLSITRPDGAKRVIFFERGQAFGYDPGEADTGPFRASRRSDVTMLQIGRERYEIPDAVVYGS